VKSVGPPSANPSAIYEIENEKCNQQLELAFGRSARFFNMDKVSNSPFTDREFNRLVLTCKEEGVTMPTQVQVQKKREAIKGYEVRVLTDADVTAIVARRKALNNPDGQSLHQRIAEGSRLRQEYNTARARGDKVEANRLRLELDAYNARYGPTGNGVNSGSDTEAVARLASGLGKTGIAGSSLANGGGGNTSVLEEISKRNRQLNHEDARRIQVAEAERRKKAQMERIREAEAAKKSATGSDDANTMVSSWNAKENPELAGKDIGTQMAHMVEIDLPDF